MANNLRERVQRFGLTEKEAKTYLAILDHGPVTATEAAELSDISRRYVYNVSKKLEELDLVVVNDYFTPTTIEPLPPEEVRKQINKRTEELYQNIENRYRGDDDDEHYIKVLKSRSTVLKNMEDFVAQSNYILFLSLPSVVVPKIESLLKETVDRGVLVLLLVSESNGGEQQALDNVDFERISTAIRYIDISFPALLSSVPPKTGGVDHNDKAMLVPRGVITRPESTAKAIYIEQTDLESFVFDAFVNTYWTNAQEIHHRPPNELPHTYQNLRRAAIDATLHMQDGKDIGAVVKARPAEQPESVVELDGTVQEVKQRLVNPTTEPQPTKRDHQCAFYVDIGSDTVSIGDSDAFFEDYRTYQITLRPA